MKQKLNLNDLADRMMLATGLSYDKVEAYLDTFFALTEEVLLDEHLVKIKGLGDFKIADVAPRSSVDVNSKQPIVIKSHARITFTADTALNNSLNAPFAHLTAVELHDEAIPFLNEADEAYEAYLAELQQEPFEEEHTDALPNDLPTAVLDTPTLTTPTPSNTDTLEEASHTEASPCAIAAERQAQLTAPPTTSEHEPTSHFLVPPSVEHGEAQVAEQRVEEITEEEEEEEADKEKEEEQPQNTPATASTDADTPTTGRCHSLACKALIALLLLLLIIGAYFLGQYHNSKPSAPTASTTTMPSTAPTPTTADTTQADSTTADTLNVPATPDATPVPSPPTKDSDKATTNQPATATQSATATPTAKPATPTATASQPTAAAKTTEPDYDNTYPQVAGSNYQIIGTQRNLTLNTGKGLMQIAREEYGDARCYQHIVTYNNIKNPNNVPRGTTIKLPKLRKRTTNP